MMARALLHQAWHLHELSPQLIHDDPEGLIHLQQALHSLLDDLHRVLQEHAEDKRLSALMQQHYADALMSVIALSRELVHHIEASRYPGTTLEGHVTFVMAAATSIIVDLLFRVLESYAELAANLDGSQSGFEEAPSLLHDCRRLVQPDPKDDQRLQQLAHSLASIRMTDLDA